MTLILTFLLPIALGLISVRGQNASGNAAYPQWVTNDYNCGEHYGYTTGNSRD